MLLQRGFHLARLHTVAAQLELVVHAAEELDPPIRQQPRPVPRAVHPRSRSVRVWIRHEAFGRQVRAAQVATTDNVAADAQLSGDARGHRGQPPIQHVDAGVGDGPTERHGRGDSPLRSAWHLQREHAHRRLGGPVVVEDLQPGRQRVDPVDERPVRHVSAQHQSLARKHPLRVAGGQERLQVGGDDLQAVHALPLEERGERRRVRDVLPRHQVQHTAPAECREDRGVAEVRRQGGHGGEAGRVRQLQPQRDTFNVVDELPMLDGHALRPTRGARGEDDVGEVLRRSHGRRIRAAPAGQHGGVAVELDERPSAPPEFHREGRLRDECSRPRVHEDGSQALNGEGGVQGHVGATRLEDAPEAHEGARGAVQIEAHPHVGPHAQLAQVVRQLVRAPVQLPVGQARVLCDDGLGVRSPSHLRLEEGLHGGGCEGGVRVVPVHEQPPLLRVPEDGEVRQPRVRSAKGRLQQHAQVPHHPVHRVALEEVAVVRDVDGEPLGHLGHRQ